MSAAFSPHQTHPPKSFTSHSTRRSPLPARLHCTYHDPSLQSTMTHRTQLATGCTTVLIALAKSASHQQYLQPLLAAFAGYIFSDLGSGVYHWAIDNYGDSSTLLFGAQIQAFQGHHRRPWIITRRQFSNNLHALANFATIALLPFDVFVSDPIILAFAGVFMGCIMFSQQFHAWAHGNKTRVPPFVKGLQDAGVLISPANHGAHHLRPYNCNYCIVSGVWNELLKEHKVFEAAEMAVFFKLGLKARSWEDHPDSEWTQEAIDDPEIVH